MGSDYHLYQVLGDTGIGLGDDGDPRMLRREFGSATDDSLQFFFLLKIQPDRKSCFNFASTLVSETHILKKKSCWDAAHQMHSAV